MKHIDALLVAGPQWTLALNSWLGMLEHRLTGPNDFILLETAEDLMAGTVPKPITYGTRNRALEHHNVLDELIGYIRHAMRGGIKEHLGDTPSAEDIKGVMEAFKYIESNIDELDTFLADSLVAIFNLQKFT